MQGVLIDPESTISDFVQSLLSLDASDWQPNQGNYHMDLAILDVRQAICLNIICRVAVQTVERSLLGSKDPVDAAHWLICGRNAEKV